MRKKGGINEQSDLLVIKFKSEQPWHFILRLNHELITIAVTVLISFQSYSRNKEWVHLINLQYMYFLVTFNTNILTFY